MTEDSIHRATVGPIVRRTGVEHVEFLLTLLHPDSYDHSTTFALSAGDLRRLILKCTALVGVVTEEEVIEVKHKEIGIVRLSNV